MILTIAMGKRNQLKNDNYLYVIIPNCNY